MKYTGLTYRPPYESSSILLQVTAGCSHNRCSFCTMYRKVPFAVESLEQIEADIEEASVRRPKARRVFLENGDPFVLSAERLAAIAELIHKKLPNVNTIAMYASINNIKNKTDEELRLLRGLGINELNVGVESGLDEVLSFLQKGYTSQEALHELLRLREAGIDYGANIIFGVARPELRLEHAVKTAQLLNQTTPYLVFTGTIHPEPGCPMYQQMQAGEFVENTIAEYFEEMEAFIENLNLDSCHYYALHPSNIVIMEGQLARDKQMLLDLVKKEKAELTPEQLASRPLRYGEGGVVY